MSEGIDRRTGADLLSFKMKGRILARRKLGKLQVCLVG